MSRYSQRMRRVAPQVTLDSLSWLQFSATFGLSGPLTGTNIINVGQADPKDSYSRKFAINRPFVPIWRLCAVKVVGRPDFTKGHSSLNLTFYGFVSAITRMSVSNTDILEIKSGLLRTLTCERCQIGLVRSDQACSWIPLTRSAAVHIKRPTSRTKESPSLFRGQFWGSINRSTKKPFLCSSECMHTYTEYTWCGWPSHAHSVLRLKRPNGGLLERQRVWKGICALDDASLNILQLCQNYKSWFCTRKSRNWWSFHRYWLCVTVKLFLFSLNAQTVHRGGPWLKWKLFCAQPALHSSHLTFGKRPVHSIRVLLYTPHPAEQHLSSDNSSAKFISNWFVAPALTSDFISWRKINVYRLILGFMEVWLVRCFVSCLTDLSHHTELLRFRQLKEWQLAYGHYLVLINHSAACCMISHLHVGGCPQC